MGLQHSEQFHSLFLIIYLFLIFSLFRFSLLKLRFYKI